MRPIFLLLLACPIYAAPGDWPEDRHDQHLTGLQPLSGKMPAAPEHVARFDRGRGQPSVTRATFADGAEVGLSVVAGALYCFSPDGAERWRSHPPGINFSRVETIEDLDGDGTPEALLSAGRPTEPYAAALLVSLGDGALLWRYDVEPVSYSWKLYAGNYLPGVASKQIVVVIHGYPPDEKNGYIALFEFPQPGAPPAQKWRYDFDHYTCFPSLLQTDLDGDGAKELVVETHSRMWLLDAPTGAVKQFLQWDVSPANIRSYGLVRFVDLNGDAREDFLCIANFAQHHEVLLNKDGKLEAAWHHGWPESVTTGKVATVYPEPPYADIDGDGKLEIALSMFNSEGEAAWLLRVYDAVTGELKYRAEHQVVTSLQDVDGDGRAEILCNTSHDPTRAKLEGAVILQAKDNGLHELWTDANATAVAPKPGMKAKLIKDGEKFTLNWEAEAVTLEPFTKAPKALTPFNPPAIVGPPPPALLAADLLGEGRNQIVMYADSKCSVLHLEGETLSVAKEYPSSAIPVLADLDGDGVLEIVTCDVRADATPSQRAVTPSKNDEPHWAVALPPPSREGLPHARLAYLRAGRFTGKPTPDIYLYAGTPLVRSVVLDGMTGALVWEKVESPVAERYWAPTVNLASVLDFDADGAEDLVFTNPDYYCVANGMNGEPLFGPKYPPEIFSQPSQGLYTLPVILDGAEPRVCLVNGHYFQASMTLHAEPKWHRLPKCGEHAPAAEGFLKTPEGEWLMGYGRQDGLFECRNVNDGSTRWQLDLQATTTEVVTCNIDGDGQTEFLFGTSHGQIVALGDGIDKPREVWRKDMGAGVNAIIVADVTGDGASDVVAGTADGWVRLMTRN